MKTHELKTWPKYFEAVRTGVKTFEIRKDDRDERFKVGDRLRPSSNQGRGRRKCARVVYGPERSVVCITTRFSPVRSLRWLHTSQSVDDELLHPWARLSFALLPRVHDAFRAIEYLGNLRRAPRFNGFGEIHEGSQKKSAQSARLLFTRTAQCAC